LCPAYPASDDGSRPVDAALASRRLGSSYARQPRFLKPIEIAVDLMRHPEATIYLVTEDGATAGDCRHPRFSPTSEIREVA
jgi:hypothetical protein